MAYTIGKVRSTLLRCKWPMRCQRASGANKAAFRVSSCGRFSPRSWTPNVFSQPAAFTLGNVSPLVANLRNHYIHNLDMSVFKHFQIREWLKLQFRAEAFNSLNRVRFSGPNTSVTGGANFGRVTAQSNDPRQVQFGLKLIW